MGRSADTATRARDRARGDRVRALEPDRERGRDRWNPLGRRGGGGGRRVRSPSGSNTGTLVLIGVNVVVFLAELSQGISLSGTSGSSLIADGGLFGPAVADGEWWRLISSAFLHAGIIHLAFNMYVLWILGGQLLEPRIGTDRFLAIYFSAVLWGAAGALLLSPNALTVGASGGVFGLFGAIVVLQRMQGQSVAEIVQGPIGIFLLLNLAITFVIPGISIGGHLGGLLGGAAAAWVMAGYGRGSLAYGQLSSGAAIGMAALTAGAIGVSLFAAG